ncbi:hypothetical protein BDF19DRAFT_450721 [Syncephalis fuscata]|nr:hypothetical protein BDF19DRAFT_450721 [Syncephalis fuscata]
MTIDQYTASGNQSILLGPFLKFQDCQLERRLYLASVLVVSSAEEPIHFSLSKGDVISVTRLDSYREYHFYRYGFSIEQTSRAQDITYTVGTRTYTFTVPAFEETWRWAFFSCNGFSNDIAMEDRDAVYGGDQVLWEDVLQRHAAQPYHLMVGGGDQLYCDDVFVDAPSVKTWNELGTMEEKEQFEVTEEMTDEVEHYYFNNYLRFFGNGKFSEAMKIIPYSYGIDDHDIFDGFGSYPDSLRLSPVIQRIGDIATRFYLLFQQHTTQHHAEKHDFFGEVPRCYLSLMGPRTALLVPDGRCERTEQTIISSETYDAIFSRLSNMPPSIRHLIVVLGVPIVYPRLTMVENALDKISELQETSLFSAATDVLRNWGVIGHLVNNFGQPELLDDLTDHWTADCHLNERKEFIERLQMISRERSVRITFIAGDVHCCGAGYLHSKPTAELATEVDFRHMTQITSSGIVNAPPPATVISALHYTATTYDFDQDTVEDMYELFENDVNEQPLEQKKLLNRRNWCSVTDDGQDGLNFTINVEREDHVGSVGYTVNVPALRL